MSSRQSRDGLLDAINDFLAHRRIAVVGVSRSGKGFGALAARELQRKGYQVYRVNSQASGAAGLFPRLLDLPARVDGVLLCVPPDQALQVLRDCAIVGIRRVWLQTGSASPTALAFCQENGVGAVHDQCILMFAPPVRSYHLWHRWVWSLLGKLPK